MKLTKAGKPDKRYGPRDEATKQKISKTLKKTLSAPTPEQEAELALQNAEKILLSAARDDFHRVQLITNDLLDIQRRLPTAITKTTIKNSYNDTEQGKLDMYSDLADEVSSEAQIAHLLRDRQIMVAGKDMFVEAYRKEETAEAAAKFAEARLQEIPRFKNMLIWLLRAIFSGLSVAEIVYEYVPEKNFYKIKKLNPVSLKKLQYNSDLELCFSSYAGQDLSGKKLSDFPGKFLVHSNSLNNIYPIKDGLMKSAIWLWFMKQHGWVYYSAGLEKTAYPIIYATVPITAQKEHMQALGNALDGLHATGTGVLKGASTLSSINNAGAQAGNQGYQNFIAQIDDQLTRLFTGGNLNSQIGSDGSRAAAEVHAQNKFSISVFDGEALADTLRMQLVKPLLQRNVHLFGGQMPSLPKIWFDLEEYKEIDDMILGLELVTRNQMLEQYGLPKLKGDEGDQFIKTKVDSKSLLEVLAYIQEGKISRESGIQVLMKVFSMDQFEAQKLVGTNEMNNTNLNGDTNEIS